MTISRSLRSRLQALQQRIGQQDRPDCRRCVCDDIDALTAFYAGEGPRPRWVTDEAVERVSRFDQAFDALAWIGGEQHLDQGIAGTRDGR